MTEGEFTQQYAMPKIIQPCTAEMMRRTYGEDCPKWAADTQAGPESFCSCMAPAIGKLSDAQLTQLALESADYMRAAAQAKKDGKALPEPPSLLKSFTQQQVQCGR